MVMKVLWDGLPIDEVPDRTYKPGEFFTRLVGVRVSSDGNAGAPRLTVEPLYIPLLRVSRRAGQVYIEINSYSRPLVYITLQKRKPYLSLFRFPWESLESA